MSQRTILCGFFIFYATQLKSRGNKTIGSYLQIANLPEDIITVIRESVIKLQNNTVIKNYNNVINSNLNKC
ncbi:hypothetical protein Calkr_2126 [Caldicellulosiruptor acetigenus I77R1B]|uniref:Uncharacterized protein n=1 Tax=Caldicellulosiruptor acetigenus (strain ATCC 700853 / DSM 12137 / I77R1B) TaxID=632335 RepID=E4S5T1_CALA7|nr:hypothetical protein Calkr_2126 [Caldicellulosiruptor acetigenus I77R1B]